MFRPASIVAALLAAGAAAAAEELPLRDPMRPPAANAGAAGAAAAAAVPRFVLTAVVISPARRVAVVNGKPYLEGEAVDGAEIVAIELGSVRLREAGAERVVSLGRPGGERQSVEGETVR